MTMLESLITAPKQHLVSELWAVAPPIKECLVKGNTIIEARDLFFDYLDDLERHYFNIYSDEDYSKIHILEKNNAKECIRVLKNILRTENEELTNTSALKLLYKIAKEDAAAIEQVDNGFLCEFIHLFRGMASKSEVLPDLFANIFTERDERSAAVERSRILDSYAQSMTAHFRRYKIGLDPDIAARQAALKTAILAHFDATEDDWQDYKWHIRNVLATADDVASLVALNDAEREGLVCAAEHNIPFQITPYYLSLFDRDGTQGYDAVVRAQVLPSLTYCTNVIESEKKGIDMDFMGERSTSPIDAITRRYPQILILKPFDSCPQICVYCQRNWEIKTLEDARTTRETIQNAIDWIAQNESITEVLVTGGDPFTLSNSYLDWLFGEVAAIRHVERIRIGTRTFVTVPMRINDDLVEVLTKYHELGSREVALVTHFEHSLEVTADVLAAVKKIRYAGMSIYNQQVFTYYNSKRFETALLRKTLKRTGIDPYYSFNTKGKEETIDYRVPIARIEQERKEEARLLPGLVRTDEPVFNVPRIGKSHLRAWQDHEPIMILPDGRRVYRFYPWESKHALTGDYIYTDVSIYDYLKRLHADGEALEEYRSIWYYF